MAIKDHTAVAKFLAEYKNNDIDDVKHYSSLLDESYILNKEKNILGGNIKQKYIVWTKLFEKVEKESVVKMVISDELITPKEEYYNEYLKSLVYALNKNIEIKILFLMFNDNKSRKICYNNEELLDNFRHKNRKNIEVVTGKKDSISILKENASFLKGATNFETFGNTAYRLDLGESTSKFICNFHDVEVNNRLSLIFDRSFQVAKKNRNH